MLYNDYYSFTAAFPCILLICLLCIIGQLLFVISSHAALWMILLNALWFRFTWAVEHYVTRQQLAATATRQFPQFPMTLLQLQSILSSTSDSFHFHVNSTQLFGIHIDNMKTHADINNTKQTAAGWHYADYVRGRLNNNKDVLKTQNSWRVSKKTTNFYTIMQGHALLQLHCLSAVQTRRCQSQWI